MSIKIRWTLALCMFLHPFLAHGTTEVQKTSIKAKQLIPEQTKHHQQKPPYTCVLIEQLLQALCHIHVDQYPDAQTYLTEAKKLVNNDFLLKNSITNVQQLIAYDLELVALNQQEKTKKNTKQYKKIIAKKRDLIDDLIQTNYPTTCPEILIHIIKKVEETTGITHAMRTRIVSHVAKDHNVIDTIVPLLNWNIGQAHDLPFFKKMSNKLKKNITHTATLTWQGTFNAVDFTKNYAYALAELYYMAEERSGLQKVYDYIDALCIWQKIGKQKILKKADAHRILTKIQPTQISINPKITEIVNTVRASIRNYNQDNAKIIETQLIEAITLMAESKMPEDIVKKQWEKEGAPRQYAKKRGVFFLIWPDEISPSLPGNALICYAKNILQASINSAIKVIASAAEYPLSCLAANKETYYTISKKEVDYIEQKTLDLRTKIAESAVKNIAGSTVQNIPKIGFCFSGGGYRAMISTLGWLQGAYDAHILDTALYMSSLSGSTWAMATWVQKGIILKNHTKEISSNVQSTFDIKTFMPLGLTLYKQYQKTIHHLPSFEKISHLNDLYGLFLGYGLMRNSCHDWANQKLSDQQNSYNPAIMPFPIYTAVEGSASHWFEFTPHAIGSQDEGLFIKPDAFGRHFHRGMSLDFVPPHHLGYMMGIFGSAYATNWIEATQSGMVTRNLVQALSDMLKTPEAQAVISQDITQHDRFAAPKIPNFMYKVEGSHFAHKKTLHLVDGGHAFNIPIPALLHRNMDIIIVCDASGDTNQGASGKSLYLASQWAQKKNMPFPLFTQDNVAQKNERKNMTLPGVAHYPVSIHAPQTIIAQLKQIVQSETVGFYGYDNYTDGPIVIYVPLNMQQIPKTTKFDYTLQEFNQVYGTTLKQMRSVAHVIKEVIKVVAN